MADGQGLGGSEHEGRQVLAAEPGGLVQAVAAVVMASVWELSAVQSLWHLLSRVRGSGRYYAQRYRCPISSSLR